MIEYHVYPGGKKRIVTFSYDDGHPNDTRLIEIFDKYGVKGTFHLNGGEEIEENAAAELCERYKNHEISCHTKTHGWPARMPMQSVISETCENRKRLEKIAGYPVIGMSYPSGSFDDASVMAMSACGIVYSRTTLNTQNFNLPEDFMRWRPSCHHRDALGLCDKWNESIDSQWTHPLFYIWGHSHEFRSEQDWEYIEKVVSALSGNPKVWYATNIEIYRYMMAQKSLEISADERIFYNPTAIDLWVEKDKKQIIMIPAGKTVVLD